MIPRRLATVLGVLIVPWTVLVVPEANGHMIELVFAWGLFDPRLLHVVSLAAYLFEHTSGLPEYLLAWPMSVSFYGLAVASIVGGTLVGREDRRVTAGLFVLAGLTHLRFAVGISARGGSIVVPVATVVLWLLAWSNRPERLLR